ncbi:MAG: T9SS type A sorting domain-containing protein, partial [Bacteroidota bacterium]
TGDIFFATTEGLQSFLTEVIDAFDEFTDVYAYPNPVRPGYEGPIVIKGMVNDAVVKITDITGTLVYETISKGGQAVWYGKNFKGERVASGVYVVFCATSNGEQKTVTKILLVN